MMWKRSLIAKDRPFLRNVHKKLRKTNETNFKGSKCAGKNKHPNLISPRRNQVGVLVLPIPCHLMSLASLLRK